MADFLPTRHAIRRHKAQWHVYMEEYWPSAIDNTALKSLEKKKGKKKSNEQKVSCSMYHSKFTNHNQYLDDRH